MAVLPDDILLMVLDLLEDDASVYSGADLTQRKVARNAYIGLSMVNRRLRFLAAPRLFRSIHLGPTWRVRKIRKALDSVTRSPDALARARKLQIDLWLGGYSFPVEELSLARQLAVTIPTFGRLEKLTMTMTIRSAMTLKVVFRETAVEFPRILELVLSPRLDWMIAMCPNLRSISTHDWIVDTFRGEEQELAFIEAASILGNQLEHFSLHCRWKTGVLERVLQAMPNLRRLGMPGPSDWLHTAESIAVLRRFRNLERLQLASDSKLAQTLSECDPPYAYRRFMSPLREGLAKDERFAGEYIMHKPRDRSDSSSAVNVRSVNSSMQVKT